MSRIFISHSSANNAAALAIAKWLADAGWAEYFLDITPSRGLAPGERWQEALKSAADRCEAVLFLISPAWQASRWCLAEFLLAKQIGKTIFGVLVEATPLDALPKEMTAEWQLCDLVTGSARQSFRVSQEPIVPETEVSFAEDGLVRLRIGLQRAGLDPASFAWPPPSDPNRPPYRGLKALEPEDAAIFFGRESAIVRGLDALRGSRERGVERLFVILGASGAGKSSYLRAGLWPRLVRDDTRFLPLAVVRPERAVISGAPGLAASLETAFRERKAARSRAVINQALQEPGGFDRLLAELQTLARSRIDPEAPPPTVVISIDQGEELFGAEGGAEAERFLDLLGQTLSPPAGEGAEALAARQRALAIIGIRSDSYERLQTEPRLEQVAPYLFSLPPIARAEFKTIVEGPARRHTEAGHKLTVDPALTERLVDETEGADALPLLAFTLERLFVEHGGDGKLRLEDYDALGGVRGSIEAAIAAAFAEPGCAPIVPADKTARERLLRAGFIPWLARVDPETEERKRRVARWEEIPPEARPLLERLIEQRLLVRDRRKLDSREDVVVVEVAHEALLRQWPTLTAWLDEDAVALKILDAVQRAAGDWVKNRGENSAGEAWLIHTGERLVAAEALRQRPDFDRLLGADGQAYLEACRARDDRLRKEKEERAEAERMAKERELEQAKALAEEQRQRADEQAAARLKQRRLSWLFGLAAVAAVITAVYAWHQKGVASEQRAEAQAQRTNAEEKRREAVAGKLVMQSGAILEGQIPARPDVGLLLAAAAFRLKPNNEAYGGLKFALDATPASLSKIAVLSDPVAALSADGLTAATAGKALRLWKVDTGQPIGEPLWQASEKPGDVMRVMSVAFNRDGTALAAGLWAGEVLSWDVPSGRPRGVPMSERGNTAKAVALSPDGRTLASGHSYGVLRLWDVSSGESRLLDGHKLDLSALAFSADGNMLASGGLDDAVRQWRPATGELIGVPIARHSEEELQALVYSATELLAVTYSADGDTLAAGGHEGRVHLWNATSGQPLGLPIAADKYSVSSLAFSPDGRTLASGGDEHVVRLWHVSTREPRGAGFFQGHTEAITAVAFRGDATLVSGSRDKTLRLWDLTAEQRHSLALPWSGLGVKRVAISPDGMTVATGGADGSVRVWDATSGQQRGETQPGHGAQITSLAFSADGRTLASGGHEGTVRLWDAASGASRGAAWKVSEYPVESLAFSPDGHTLAAGSYVADMLRLWDVTSGQAHGDALRGHRDGGVIALAFSPDGKTLASGGDDQDKTVRLWDTISGQPRREPLNHDSRVTTVAFSPDGKTLVSGAANGTLWLWDAASGEARGAPLQGHDKAVTGVAFAGDATTLASGSGDNSVRLWDMTNGQPRASALEGHEHAVRGLAFKNGSRLVSVDGHGVLRVWDAPAAWIDRVCDKLVRNLSRAEWKQYVGDIPYTEQCPGLPVPADRGA